MVCATRAAFLIYETAHDLVLDSALTAFQVGIKEGFNDNGDDNNGEQQGEDDDSNIESRSSNDFLPIISISDTFDQYVVQPFYKFQEIEKDRLEAIKENNLSDYLLRNDSPKKAMNNLLDKIMIESGTSLSSSYISSSTNSVSAKHTLNAAVFRVSFLIGKYSVKNLP